MFCAKENAWDIENANACKAFVSAPLKDLARNLICTLSHLVQVFRF